MKEFDKMTDEELNAVAKGAKAEIKKRQSAIKKEYNDRYNALCKIEKAFQDYYYKFNGELPYIRVAGIIDEPIRVQMIADNDNKDYPYLFFYRR